MFLGTAYICGFFNLVLALAMLVPMAVDFAVGSPDWQVFFASSAIVGIPSLFMVIAMRREMPQFSLRFGFLVVNALWVSTSVAAAIPLMLGSQKMGITDAIFESVSGLTTTGSTVVSGLDNMPVGFLLWRSMTQWFGGLGIIAMGLLLLPFLRVGGMQVYKMESSLQGDSPYSRFAEFSRALVGLYLMLSVGCALGYLIAGMSVFDAINHAMSTVSTGGYSTHDASLGYYGRPVHLVSIVFMIGGALPFIALLKAAVSGDYRDAMEIQVPVLLGILVGLSVLVTLFALPHTTLDPLPMLIDVLFNITSVVTTTGYASTDYTLWGPSANTLFLLAMFLGGAAGSTSGGIKTYRLIILYQSLRTALQELVYPNGVFIVRYQGAQLNLQTTRSVAMFAATFMGLLLLITVGLGTTGLDLVTALSGALTALTNVGPGLGEVIGPAGNFSTLSLFAKWQLIVAMLLGRLEILTVLVLVTPTFWKR